MRIEVLDHGYLQLIESWGSDERIIEAARQSTQGGFKGWGPTYTCKKCGGAAFRAPEAHGWDGVCSHCGDVGQSGISETQDRPGDEKLLRYLWENKHSTPFEFAGACFEVQAPIFVFREWHRHRTQSYSEASARYEPLPDIDYIPSADRLLMTGGRSKQSRAVTDKVLDREGAEMARYAIRNVYEQAQREYGTMLANGVPKELARVVLPVGRYSRMRATANLRNWLGFLTLRDDVNAQWEIRQYAVALHGMLREKFPRTMALYMESRNGQSH